MQSKTKLETILDYTSEIKECVITLVKESHLKNQKIVDLELKLELETQKTHKNSGVQIEIINQLNKKMESINQSIDLKSQNSSHSIAIQNPRLEKYQILKDLLFNIILSLLSKAESLKRKTQFYAKNSRLYWKILNKYETDIKDILISKENLNKTPIKKFKISA